MQASVVAERGGPPTVTCTKQRAEPGKAALPTNEGLEEPEAGLGRTEFHPSKDITKEDPKQIQMHTTQLSEIR